MTKVKVVTVVLVGLLAGSSTIACGDSDEEINSAYCDKVAQCTGIPKQQCLTGLQKESTSPCAKQSSESSKCVSEVGTCQGGQLAVPGTGDCKAKVDAYATCARANPGSASSSSGSSGSIGSSGSSGSSGSDPACGACIDQKCATELDACKTNAACYDCLANKTSCDLGQTDADAYLGCTRSKCAAACN